MPTISRTSTTTTSRTTRTRTTTATTTTISTTTESGRYVRTRDPGGLLVLGLGSNLGDRLGMLRTALDRLTALCGPLEVAPIYQTRAVSPVNQGDFLNTIAIARLDEEQRLDPAAAHDWLETLKGLEEEAGRTVGGPRFGPRVLDLDLLLFGALEIEEAEPTEPGESRRWLTLPHPRLRQRRFVLAPLADLAPELALPPDGARVAHLLKALGTEQEIERYGNGTAGKHFPPIPTP